MIDDSANHDFLSLTIETSDKSSIVIMPTGFDVGPMRREHMRDNGVIYTQIDFSASGCKGTIHDVLLPEHFYRLHHALTELIEGKHCDLGICGLEPWFGLELFNDDSEKQIVCRVTMPSKHRHDTRWCLYDHTSAYPGSMRTFVELELWLEPSMLKSMLSDTEAILERIRELGEV